MLLYSFFTSRSLTLEKVMIFDNSRRFLPLSVALSRLSQSVSVTAIRGSAIMLIARGPRLQANLKREQTFLSLSQTLQGESSLIINSPMERGQS